ncbi:MAG: polysaccharide pyruvyl transferase family protein [Prochlorococcus marinus CUG1435]|nr:polysaccharide pyruvyl transferase family protein [Prochlorococcus marinus CUG1435]
MKSIKWDKIEITDKTIEKKYNKYLIFEPKNRNELIETKEFLEKHISIEICLIILNLDLVRFLNTFPKTFKNVKTFLIYYPLMKDNFSNNDSFEISSFLSRIANQKGIKSNYLNDFYNKKGYELLLNQKNIDNKIKKYMLSEFNLIKFSNKKILKNIESEMSSIINKGISNNMHKFINFPVEQKTYRKLKLYIYKVIYSLRNIINKINFSVIISRKKKSTNPRKWKNVLITGWYGTETTGDKAILGEIINRIQFYNPEMKIKISTIDLLLSWQTRIEMNLNVEFINITEMSNFIKNSQIDSLILGGGPIMYTRFLKEISECFRISQLKKMNNIIFGCGIGPIKNKNTENIIKKIFNNTDKAIFRDKESHDLAIRFGLESEKSYIGCDPALKYIKDISENFGKSGKVKTTSLLIREPTKEYNFHDLDSFAISKEMIKQLFSKYFLDHIARPISMHMYFRGIDDRCINNNIVKELNKSDYYNSYEYKDIFSIIKEIKNSDLTIVMRYHAHIFSLGLGVPFLSVDYTGKSGKIKNLLRSIKMEDYIISDKLFNKNIIEELLSEDHTNKLVKKRDELVNKLVTCYDKIWGS